MAWVRSDPDEPLHPKIFRAGIAAYGFFQAAKCYAMKHLTDGFIPVGDLPLVFPGVPFKTAVALAQKLAECGLFDVEEKGYRVHDYLHYNPDRSQVLTQFQSSRMGGEARAKGALRLGGRFASSKPAGKPADHQPPAGEPLERLVPADHQHSSLSLSQSLKSSKTTTARASRAPDPRVQQVLKAYHDAHCEAAGEKPNITGKDAAIARQLVMRHGLDKVLEQIARMYRSTDPFILASGRTLGVLSSCWNKLLTDTSAHSFGTDVSGLVRFAQKGSDGLAGPKALRD